MSGLIAPRMHLTSSVESVTNVDAFPASLEALNTPFVWQILWWMSLITAGLTAFYTFRAFFMTFTGPTRVPHEAGHHAHESPPTMTGPLVLLAIASGVSGIWILEHNPSRFSCLHAFTGCTERRWNRGAACISS